MLQPKNRWHNGLLLCLTFTNSIFKANKAEAIVNEENRHRHYTLFYLYLNIPDTKKNHEA
jgi:hypothetical protein